jgi:hypothetical protein
LKLLDRTRRPRRRCATSLFVSMTLARGGNPAIRFEVRRVVNFGGDERDPSASSDRRSARRQRAPPWIRTCSRFHTLGERRAAFAAARHTSLKRSSLYGRPVSKTGIRGALAQKLVNDTQRALAPAKAYVGPNGANPGDGDGINCLTPGLAIFKAGVQVPAQNEVPAVMSAVSP